MQRVTNVRNLDLPREKRRFGICHPNGVSVTISAEPKPHMFSPASMFLPEEISEKSRPCRIWLTSADLHDEAKRY